MDTTLEELKSLWAEQDRKLDSIVHLNVRLLRSIEIKPTRTALGRLTAGIVAEAIFTAVTILLAGSFFGDNAGVPALAISGAVMLISAIGLFISLVRQIVIVRSIDYTEPVTHIQKNVEALRIVRIRTTQALLLCSVALWAPLLIVGGKALFGTNLYDALGPAYVWSNIALGVALIPIALWIARRMGAATATAPAVRYLARTINGSSLNSAIDFLAALAAFETDEKAR